MNVQLTALVLKENINVLYTNEELSYDDAVKSCPKGYRMITLEVMGRIFKNQPLDIFGFYFWFESPKWNKTKWRPVARGYKCDYNFDLFSNNNPTKSRVIYVKEEFS